MGELIPTWIISGPKPCVKFQDIRIVPFLKGFRMSYITLQKIVKWMSYCENPVFRKSGITFCRSISFSCNIAHSIPFLLRIPKNITFAGQKLTGKPLWPFLCLGNSKPIYHFRQKLIKSAEKSLSDHSPSCVTFQAGSNEHKNNAGHFGDQTHWKIWHNSPKLKNFAWVAQLKLMPQT